MVDNHGFINMEVRLHIRVVTSQGHTQESQLNDYICINRESHVINKYFYESKYILFIR